MPSVKKKNDDDLFDAIVFRDTAGAPRSFTDYSDYSSTSKRSQGTHRSYRSLSRVGTGTGTRGIGANANARSVTTNNAMVKPKPKVTVKIFVHEEVSSTQDKKNALDEVSAHVLLDGAIHAKVSSHSRSLNPPFGIRITDPDYPEDTNFQFDTNFLTVYGAGGTASGSKGKSNLKGGEYNTLTVPRAVREQFKIASYHRSVTKKFMPVLVQSKVERFGGDELEQCKISIQIRSNLNNVGSLRDITVAVAVPPTVLSKTLKLTTGAENWNGSYDELKRVIKWRVNELSQGSSVAFGAEVRVAGAGNEEKNGGKGTQKKKQRRRPPMMMADELPRFPILLRCSSIQDTVSSVQVDCKELEGGRHPADIDVIMQRSFKLLHRLPP